MQQFGGTRWSAGDVILSRQILDGQVWAVFPEYVVHDDGDLLISFIQTGSEMGFPEAQGLGRHPWRGRYTHWRGHGSLSFARAGEPWGYSIFWAGPEREFECWYVDLMAPYRRFDGGVDGLDHELDLVVHPDGRIEEKDVELFEEEVAAGRYGEELARSVRRDFTRVKETLERDGVPYDKTWERWTPPTEWGALALPDGWADFPVPTGGQAVGELGPGS